MKNLKEISKPVAGHLEEFNKYFNDVMKSDVALLNIILKYVLSKKGKQVRPSLVFLSAGMFGDITERSYVGASMVELLHTATLIHDDVVDQATQRRGIASINAKWNNKISVLIGDFLLSKGLMAAIDRDEFRFLKVTSKAVKRMSEGELLSIQKSKDLDVDEEVYFRIISAKTASLFAACCEIGTISVTDDQKTLAKMNNFGELLGIAFQIRDDIFDYTSNAKLIGKPVGNDLREKKITLPLLHAFSKSTKKEKSEVSAIIKDGKLKKKDISGIIDFVTDKGGIAYAEEKAREYAYAAKDILEEFDGNMYRDALLNFTDFVIERQL